MKWIPGPWDGYPWWKKILVWMWWKPRLLWRWPRAIGNPVREHETGKIRWHLNWRGAWREQSALIEHATGQYETMCFDESPETEGGG